MQRYITLLCLYIAQSVPMSFFSTVVPVIMRQENYSLTSIGLLQLVKLPWVLKFLWAPAVDRTAGGARGYIRWIVGSEIFYAITIIAVGFLSLETDFKLIAMLVLIAVTASATQDIATDAFAIFLLKKSDRSMGNGMQSAGGFIGSLLGSGVLLLIYSYFSWQLLLFALAAFVLVALIPLFVIKPQAQANGVINQPDAQYTIRYVDIFRFFKQKAIGWHAVFLTIYYFGIIGILTVLKPLLVDLGYPIEKIGVLSGVAGTATAAVCAFFAGWLVRKIGLQKGVQLFAALMIFVPCYFYGLALSGYATPYVYAGVLIIWGIYGMASVVVYTLSMNCVRQACEGTDFTVQTVLVHLGSLIFGVAGSKIADIYTYKGLFFIEIVVAGMVFLYTMFFYNKKLSH